MKYYHNNKLYISTDELSRTFTRDYGFYVSPYHINRLCFHYHIPHLKKNNMNFFYSNMVSQTRQMNITFMDYLKEITKDS